MEAGIEGSSDADVHRHARRLAAAGEYEAARRLLATLRERQTSELMPSHPAVGHTLAELALIDFAQGRNGEARSLAEEAIAIWCRSLGPANPTLAHRVREFAEAAEKAGDAPFAAVLRQRNAEGPGPLASRISPLSAETLHAFANSFAQRGEFEDAERHLVEAIRLWRASPASRFDLALALSDLGEVLRRTGRFDEAEPVEAEACTIVAADDAPSLIRATVLSNYGLLNTKKCNFSRARLLYQQAIDLYRADSPCSHRLGIAVFNMASLYEAMADVTTAERLYVEAADILERSVGVNHISFSLVANNLGNLYRLTNRLAAAENLLRRAVDVRRHHLGAQHPWLAASLLNLGLALTHLSRPGEADAALVEAIGILEARKLPGIDLPYAYQALAVLRSLQRDWSSADTLLEKAMRLLEAALGSGNVVLAHMLSNLAFVRAACGRPREALSLMGERAATIEDAMLADAASVLSDQQRIGLLAQLSSHLIQVLAIVRGFFATSADAVRIAFHHVLARKAVSAEIMSAQRETVMARGDEATQTRLRRLSEVNGEIGRLATEGPGRIPPEAHWQTLAGLQRRRRP